MTHNGVAPGKIILSGEYAVVFGYVGIAVPSVHTLNATFQKNNETQIIWKGSQGGKEWDAYIRDILKHCDAPSGTLTIETDLPLGKGMGTSTAAVIAIARCLLGEDCEEKAKEIEDALNPGHSGLDFAVIWNNAPVRFTKKDGAKQIEISSKLLSESLLIDTGHPNETTMELVAWMKERETEIADTLKNIGECSLRLEAQEDMRQIIRDHHKLQVELGVVPPHVQSFIAAIEEHGGSAKVIGAGARTGGGGMVLALDVSREFVDSLLKPS